MRNTVLEISRKAFINNYETVKSKVSENIKVMPVVKANGYGTYLNRDSNLMNKFDIVAVAIVEEAVHLREYGYKNDILVLNQPYVNEIDDIVENDIIVGVSSIDFVKEVVKSNKKMRVHIELETGMGRTGVLKSELSNFLEKINSENFFVEGVYTHLSSPDIDYEFTTKQIKIFNDGVSMIKEVFPNIKYVHTSASNGILNFDLGICNMVRPGLILYGYPSSKATLDKIKLEPVARLKSKISFIKDVEEGSSISYGRTFVSSSKMKVATVGCGYADGIKRGLSNKGFVSVNGKKCRILGRVCMDSFMIDVSDVDVKVNDDVYIFDNEVVTIDEIASICDTINYEIISTIGERVIRKFID